MRYDYITEAGKTVTQDTRDPWLWWQNALVGKRAPIDVNEPETGYYRVRDKRSEQFSPVAYWLDSKTGKPRCHVNGADLNEQRALELWPYASRRPVTAEAYQERLRTGKWPDENSAVIGHNKMPMGNDPVDINDRIEDLAREAEQLIAAGPAQSDEEANQASDLAQTFGELEGKISRLHKEEKEPFLEAGRTVDRKWFGLRDRAAELKRRLKAAVITPFLTRKHQETENAEARAVLSGGDPAALPEVRLTAGTSKRSTALRTFLRAEIEDKAKLLDALKDHPEVVACIQAIADAAAKKKLALPGCRVVTEKRAA